MKLLEQAVVIKNNYFIYFSDLMTSVFCLNGGELLFIKQYNTYLHLSIMIFILVINCDSRILFQIINEIIVFQKTNHLVLKTIRALSKDNLFLNYEMIRYLIQVVVITKVSYQFYRSDKIKTWYRFFKLVF